MCITTTGATLSWAAFGKGVSGAQPQKREIVEQSEAGQALLENLETLKSLARRCGLVR
jgi:hypothetical protein